MAEEEQEEDVNGPKHFRPSKNFNYRLSKKQIFKMKQVFDAHDDDYDGIIDTAYLGVAMRAAGLLVSNEEIAESIKALEIESPHTAGTIEMSRFFILVATKFRDAGEIDKAAAAAFKGIYTDPTDALSKRIPLKAFRSKISASGGEQFSEEEAEAFTRSIPRKFLTPDGVNAIFDDLIALVLDDLPDLEEESPEGPPPEGGKEEGEKDPEQAGAEGGGGGEVAGGEAGAEGEGGEEGSSGEESGDEAGLLKT